jgi:hypothetical protein
LQAISVWFADTRCASPALQPSRSTHVLCIGTVLWCRAGRQDFQAPALALPYPGRGAHDQELEVAPLAGAAELLRTPPPPHHRRVSKVMSVLGLCMLVTNLLLARVGAAQRVRAPSPPHHRYARTQFACCLPNSSARHGAMARHRLLISGANSCNLSARSTISLQACSLKAQCGLYPCEGTQCLVLTLL